jgi:hypothetical protein
MFADRVVARLTWPERNGGNNKEVMDLPNANVTCDQLQVV